MEEGECKVQWFFNDEELFESETLLMTFDGTYAKLCIPRYIFIKCFNEENKTKSIMLNTGIYFNLIFYYILVA